MKIITDIKSFTTGFNKAYNEVKSISIADFPYKSDNVGEEYKCLGINNRSQSNQVVKIWYNGENCSKLMKTIRNLQKKTKDYLRELKNDENKNKKKYPALIGIPQYSFEGRLNDKIVFGYSLTDLYSLGYIDLEEILLNKTRLKEYQKISLKSKLSIASQLIEAFEALNSLRFLHANLNKDTVLVNLHTLSCALIYFEGGIFINNPSDRVHNFGQLMAWLAPEIMEQYSKGISTRKNVNDLIPVKINLLSDLWSISICIHYLIFTFHPFFFFSELTYYSLSEYINSGYKFPNVDMNYKYVTKGNNLLLYGWYRYYFDNNLPKKIKSNFEQAFLIGCLTPEWRVNYIQWKLALSEFRENDFQSRSNDDEKLTKKPNILRQKNEVIKFIENGNTKKAISFVLENELIEDKNILLSMYQLSNQINQIENEINIGLISRDDAQVIRNRITKAILEIIEI